jgi:hypothetical protein
MNQNPKSFKLNHLKVGQALLKNNWRITMKKISHGTSGKIPKKIDAGHTPKETKKQNHLKVELASHNT